MRIIAGYVCIVQVAEGYEVLFGPNKGRGQGKYEAFLTNDLTPFSTLHEAHAAGHQLQERDDLKNSLVSFGRIRMKLATNNKEIFSLEKKKSLAVVRLPDPQESYGQMLLIGVSITSKDDDVNARPPRYPLYGQLMSDNGLLPFVDFEQALYVAQEEVRQAQYPTTIATFFFKRLKSPKSA